MATKMYHGTRRELIVELRSFCVEASSLEEAQRLAEEGDLNFESDDYDYDPTDEDLKAASKNIINPECNPDLYPVMAIRRDKSFLISDWTEINDAKSHLGVSYGIIADAILGIENDSGVLLVDPKKWMKDV